MNHKSAARILPKVPSTRPITRRSTALKGKNQRRTSFPLAVDAPVEWTAAEQRFFENLNSPQKIQAYLEEIRYSHQPCYTRSPREVIKVRKARCVDGALFAAAALEYHGYPPLVVDLRANEEDDDHVIAVFRHHGRWGALAKSNYVGIRYRDPVYTTVRELVMSYFNIYFNVAGKKTLREYSQPFNLNALRGINWRTSPDNLDFLCKRLDAVPHRRLIDSRMEQELMDADERMLKAETVGQDRRSALY